VDDQITEGGTVYKQILKAAKLRIENRGKNRADLEKFFKEANVRIGIYYHLRRKRKHIRNST
jgi:hypothetical protein